MRNKIVLFAAALVVFIFVVFGFLAASAEVPLRIDHVKYDETNISGHVLNIEKGVIYYARVTLLTDDNVYIIFETQVDENGTWSIDLCYSADYVILQIVDKPYLFIPALYRVYDTVGMPAEY